MQNDQTSHLMHKRIPTKNFVCLSSVISDSIALKKATTRQKRATSTIKLVYYH